MCTYTDNTEPVSISIERWSDLFPASVEHFTEFMDGWYATEIKAWVLQMLMEFILLQITPQVRSPDKIL
jgi:hypothetical protein